MNVALSANKRYLVDREGKPFFWLGDTAWEMLHRLTREEIRLYLDDRAAKGFNVIQTVILAELDGLRTPNAYGQKPLINDDPERINEEYFQLVDFALEESRTRGMILALLPTWGDKVRLLWGKGPLVFTEENARAYGGILGRRYSQAENLVWVMGGDRVPENNAQERVFAAIAEGIRDGDRNHLMTYHPVGDTIASDYFDKSWLDIDMFQSGHCNTRREYEFVERCRNKSEARPVINGEARYENIGNAFWEKTDDAWLDDFDVRVSAYWSMLAGAAGYTYGCNDVWQMYETGRTPVISARTDWKEAIHLPGSRQMGIMKTFFEKYPWQNLGRNQGLILNPKNDEDESYILCAITPDKKLLIAYTPTGKPITVNLPLLPSGKIAAQWFNPRSGRELNIGEFTNEAPQTFTPWATGRGSDFLLVLES